MNIVKIRNSRQKRLTQTRVAFVRQIKIKYIRKHEKFANKIIEIRFVIETYYVRKSFEYQLSFIDETIARRTKLNDK